MSYNINDKGSSLVNVFLEEKSLIVTRLLVNQLDRTCVQGRAPRELPSSSYVENVFNKKSFQYITGLTSKA